MPTYDPTTDPTGTNVALNKTVTMSADPFGGAAKAVDGITDTAQFVDAGTGAAFCQVDFGTLKWIDRINIRHYYGDGRTYNATKAEASVDGTTWVTVFDSAVSGTYAEAAAGKDHKFVAGQYRYIRDHTNGSNANTSNHWVEVEAWLDNPPALANASGASAATVGQPVVVAVGGVVDAATITDASAAGYAVPPPVMPKVKSVPFAGPVPVVRPPAYFVVIRNSSLQRIGAIYPTTVRMHLRYNDVSTWSVNVPLDRTNADLLRTPGAGVLIYRGDAMDQDPILSGPVGSRTINLTEDGPHITCEGPDDLVWVSGRVAYQMPNRTVENQGATVTGETTNTHDRRSGAAESVIKGYVAANAGPAALTVRRRLTVETDAGRGASVAGSARMTPLLDLIRPLAETGGVGFKVVQTPTGDLEFRVFTPADRTGSARFAAALGNLTDWTLFERAPSTTNAIVGGQGQMANRLFVEQTDTTTGTTWPGWRMENFQNRTDTNLTAELNQTLAENLLEGGPHIALTVQTRDTPNLRFGRDFRMGDRVSVEPWPGRVVQDVLREVEIDWTADDGEQVVFRVGTVETTGTPAIQRLARKLKVKSEAVETVE